MYTQAQLMEWAYGVPSTPRTQEDIYAALLETLHAMIDVAFEHTARASIEECGPVLRGVALLARDVELSLAGLTPLLKAVG